MKKRIFIGLGLILLIFILGSAFAIISITRTTHSMDRLIMLHQIELQRERLIIHLQQVQSNVYRIRSGKGKDIDLLIAQAEEMDKAINACLSCHHTPELTQGLFAMRDTADEYKAAISRLFTATVNPERALALERRAMDLGQDLISMTQSMAFNANARLQHKTKETMSVIKRATNILVATLLLGFVISALIAFRLARKINVPFRKLVDAMRRISGGDLQHRVDISDSEGQEFSELGTSLNLMTQSLYSYRRQLVQSAKLAAIGELSTNIAYEVNNPLTGVLGYTSLLLKAGDIPDDKKAHLRTIERETLRAREILKNLLEFARRKPPCLVSVDIRGVIDDAVSLVRSQARLGGIEIVTEYDGIIPAVALDPDEMKQVFVNIMNNAIFAMPGGGKLSIRCSREKNGSGSEFVKISFTDTGSGIPEAYLDKIFDPFFTTRSDGTGTGLGLSISFMIVQNHGGRIEVESTVGKGSTFMVVLPIETGG